LLPLDASTVVASTIIVCRATKSFASSNTRTSPIDGNLAAIAANL
jgi:hypothetical protein